MYCIVSSFCFIYGCLGSMVYVFFIRVSLSFSFFFFSSRRRHTRCLSDWSSDVCSSDLARAEPDTFQQRVTVWRGDDRPFAPDEIGRAACRERVLISVGGGCVKKKKKKDIIEEKMRKRYTGEYRIVIYSTVIQHIGKTEL